MTPEESVALTAKVMKRAEKALIAADLTTEQAHIVMNVLTDILIHTIDETAKRTVTAVMEYAKKREAEKRAVE